jgi:hypothetical protein
VLSFTSFFGGAFFGGGFFAPGVETGGGTSRLLRRGKLPKKYSDIDLEAVYRRFRDEANPTILIKATQAVAEGLASPENPEVIRDELATVLIPFLSKATEVVNWLEVVKDREAMQSIIELNDEDDELLLLSVH